MSDKKMISLAFPVKLLDEIDRQAEAEYISRSDYIRQTMVKATRQREQVSAAQLRALSDELAEDAATAGYQTDADFTRLAREVRSDRETTSA